MADLPPGATGASTPSPGTGAPPAPSPAAPPWFQAFDAEMVGRMQTRGWDKLDPAAAFVEAAKAHQAAESRLGVPADRLLRIPSDVNDAEGWKEVHQKLGAPADPKDYAFEGVDFGDESLTTAFTTAMRASAAKFGLSKDAAAGIANDVFKHLASMGDAEAAETTASLAAQQKALRDNWGSNYDANLFVAQQGAKALGFSPDIFAALDKTVGFDKVMEAMRVVGQRLGEDRFVQGGTDSSGTPRVMTVQQAIARKSELLGNGQRGSGDTEFIKRYFSGDNQARREIGALDAIIVGGGI